MEKKIEIKKGHIIALLCAVFAGCLVVLSFVEYSNGDDTYFLQSCRTMKMLEYLKWRYETWTGRMASEAVTYLFFNINIWFWRIVNAGMLAVLPLLLVWVKNKVMGTGELMAREQNRNVFLCLIMAFCFYLLLDVKTFGYSCIWITGSINYLWPLVGTVLALGAVADREATWIYGLTLPCSVMVAMSSEQMGAVLIAFGILAMMADLIQKEKFRIEVFVQTLIAIGAYLFSYMAPGNALRVEESIEVYLPQFETAGIFERGFATVRWLVSSFANENTMFLMGIWLIGALVLHQRKVQREGARRGNRKYNLLQGLAYLYFLVALLQKIAFPVLGDMGIYLEEMTGKVEGFLAWSDMTPAQWGSFLWWIFALLFTLLFLWEVTEGMWLAMFTYMGAVACEAMMFFSPTIYASGERVFFVTGAMLLFLLLLLFEVLFDLDRSGKRCVFFVVILGVFHLGIQLSQLVTMLVG